MVETQHPLRVFLCHAHADRDAVHDLYRRLIRDNVDAWLDKEKLLPGQDWEYEIRTAVRKSDVVVVCLSKQFNQAGFRQKEVRLAIDTAIEQPEGEIFIIPARLEECDNLESLQKWHWVNLFEEDGYETLMRALRARADRIGATLRIKRSWLPKVNTQPAIVKKTSPQNEEYVEKKQEKFEKKSEKSDSEKILLSTARITGAKHTINIEVPTINWFFILWWIFLNLIGLLIGVVVGENLSEIILESIGKFSLYAAVAGAIEGLFLGIGQWLLLRSYLQKGEWWIPATLIAAAVGVYASDILYNELYRLNSFIQFFLPGALAGCIIGIGQWLILREETANSFLWIIVNSFCFALGLAMARATDVAILGEIIATSITGYSMFRLIDRKLE